MTDETVDAATDAAVDDAGRPPAMIPLAVEAWVDGHPDLFAPPVANRVLWPGGDFVTMVVRGPNARNDFHVDPGDEIFHQLRGTLRIDLMVEGDRVTRLVHEGEMLLVPGGVPHAPMRAAGTLGLVIERPRSPDEFDELRWYCERCGSLVHTARFHVDDIEIELASALAAFNGDQALRTCGDCGEVMAVPGPFEG